MVAPDAARAEAALRRLIERMDAVHADPAYVWVWQCAQLHGMPYAGPTYTEELNAAVAALAPRPVQAEAGALNGEAWLDEIMNGECPHDDVFKHQCRDCLRIALGIARWASGGKPPVGEQIGDEATVNSDARESLTPPDPAPPAATPDARDLVNLAHNQLRDLVTALRAQLADAEDRERDLHGRREVAEAETHAITRERDSLQAQLATVREMHETVTAQVAAATEELARKDDLLEARCTYITEKDRECEAAEAQAEALTRDRDEAVKHLHDTLREAMGNCSTDYTDFRMAVVGAEGWRIRCQTTEARVARLEAALADLSNAFVAMATVADPTPDGALIDDVVWEAAFKVCKRNEPLLTECRDKHLRPGGERG